MTSIPFLFTTHECFGLPAKFLFDDAFDDESPDGDGFRLYP